MKKILSMTVAILLVLGVFPVMQASAQWSGITNSTIIGFSSDDMLDDRDVADFGKIVLGKDTQTLRIYIKHMNFNYGTAAHGDTAQVNAEFMNHIRLEFRPTGTSASSWTINPPKGGDGRFIFKAKYESQAISASSREAVFTLTAENIGKVDMEFRLVMLDPNDHSMPHIADSDIYRMQGQYLDPTINKDIISIADHSLADVSTVAGGNALFLNDAAIDKSELGSLNVQPGDTIRFALTTDYFNWNPDILDMNSSVRKATLDNYKISVIKKKLKGGAFVKSIEIENNGGAAEVVIRFVDDFNNVKEHDFNFELALGMDGQRKEASSVTVSGTFGNPVYEVSEDKDYVFVGDGTIALALNYVRGVELDLDEGVVITMNLQSDQRYYGKATSAADADDRAIMNYFPTIRKSLTLATHNINNRGGSVRLQDQETNYFVYDMDGQYLGRSSEKLPYSQRYYLSTKEIDFDPDLVDELPWEDIESDDFGDNPTTGTGANSAFGLLLVVALAILSAAVFVVSKRKQNNY